MSKSMPDILRKLVLPRKRTMPLVPKPFPHLKERRRLSQEAKQCLRFSPVLRTAQYQRTLSAQQIEINNKRASELCRHSQRMKWQGPSEFYRDAWAWYEVFGSILKDEWFKMDKTMYKFVEDSDGKNIVKTRTPDATFGLTTYNDKALHLNREFMATGYQEDYNNRQPDDRLSRNRLRSMTNNLSCGLVVDGAWGNVNIVFPFAVYEAKKREVGQKDAKQQIQHACQIYLSMLDDLARNPDNVAEYQDMRSPHCQMFAFVSCGSKWEVYVAWSSSETCNIETLWNGDVTIPADALKLVCIVDQIHDYAVQYHRPFVLKHLTSWLNWSEKPENNHPLAALECLAAEQENWWRLDVETNLLKREKTRQTRELKKLMSLLE